jgi:RNA polymerase sigma-70 factor (ECF subfamily)
MLVRDEEAKILRKCLERIEPELREAMWLVYMEQMTYAQAAKVMGVKEKRVDRLLTRGKQQMRKELEKEGITNENRHL